MDKEFLLSSWLVSDDHRGYRLAAGNVFSPLTILFLNQSITRNQYSILADIGPASAFLLSPLQTYIGRLTLYIHIFLYRTDDSMHVKRRELLRNTAEARTSQPRVPLNHREKKPFQGSSFSKGWLKCRSRGAAPS